MHNEANQLVSDIIDIVSKVAVITLTDQNIKYTNKEEYLTNFLGVTENDLTKIVTFVVEFLPQRIYLDKYQNVKNHALSLISKELILFLVQEDQYSDEFQNNIKNFKDEMINEILNNTYVPNEDVEG